VSRIRRPANRLAKKSSRSHIPFLIKQKFIPRGTITLSGDKSIAHRALILSALAHGKTLLHNFPVHDDSLATLNALVALGVKIQRKNGRVYISGLAAGGLTPPRKPIFVDNSGTTLRLLLGVLAGMDFKAKITAGKYLSLRPMSRVNLPLRLMGAKIYSSVKNGEEYAPIMIQGGSLKGIVFRPQVASAQVKSAILLAGLNARGQTTVVERLATRDHTERMLKNFRAGIKINGNRITVTGGRNLITPKVLYIPGDISSASFFMVLAAIIPGARIVIEQLSLNPGRIGIIRALKRMGVKIKVIKQRNWPNNYEPIGKLAISSSILRGTKIEACEIPFLIDELPILMVAACFAQGQTVIKGAGELRFKETDRINSMVVNLKAMGADIRLAKVGGVENIIINGQCVLYGSNLKSFGDHRTAMSLTVAAYAACGASCIDDISCVSKSFPGFLKVLKSLNKAN
jgi:3-phosphoshikimate 1-carboxyvinyltransferase